MFYSQRLNNRIDHIHDRALRTIYQDYNSSFEEQKCFNQMPKEKKSHFAF